MKLGLATEDRRFYILSHVITIPTRTLHMRVESLYSRYAAPVARLISKTFRSPSQSFRWHLSAEPLSSPCPGIARIPTSHDANILSHAALTSQTMQRLWAWQFCETIRSFGHEQPLYGMNLSLYRKLHSLSLPTRKAASPTCVPIQELVHPRSYVSLPPN